MKQGKTMKRVMKKICTLLLAALLAVGLFPTTAFAADLSGSGTFIFSAGNALSNPIMWFRGSNFVGNTGVRVSFSVGGLDLGTHGIGFINGAGLGIPLTTAALNQLTPGRYDVLAWSDGNADNPAIPPTTIGTVVACGVKSVEVSPATATSNRGDRVSFTKNVDVENNAGSESVDDTVTWSVGGANSADTGIDSNGELTIGADETATTLNVTAQSNFINGLLGKESGSATVTVTQPPSVTSVTVSPPAANAAKGQQKQFTATVAAAHGAPETVVWAVDSTLSNIDTNGLLTVGANETASTLTVTATSTFAPNKKGTGVVTVDAPVISSINHKESSNPDPDSDSIDTTPPTILSVKATPYGKAGAVLEVVAADASPLSFQWQVQGSWIDIPGATSARFDYTGLKADQTYTVRVKVTDAKGNQSISESITFKTDAAAITGLPESYTLLVGQSVKWTPSPAGGSWRYDNAYLSMTESGGKATFKALKEGKTTATYTANNTEYVVQITINAATIPQTGDTGSPLSLVLPGLASLCGIGRLVLKKKWTHV
ncbi:MAG: Ig-like domain-containing protein [Lachnospiraceae bacterium]